MPRVDRVMDLLELLRARELLTVGAISAELGVSRRTILRDLQTLRDRGWPIRADAGRGGGVQLDRDRGVTAVHLSLDEVVALWLAAQLSTSVSALPWSRAARGALDKVLASIPRERALALRRLLRRVVIGAPATPQVRAALGAPPPELLTAFEQAFSHDHCLAFDYTDRHGQRSRRVVEPHGLLLEAPAWYLLTRDTARGEARMFRMDRIRRARALPDRSFRPDFEGLRAQAMAQRPTPVLTRSSQT